KAPSTRNSVGTIRNISEKTMKGATPSRLAGASPRRASRDRAGPGFPGSAPMAAAVAAGLLSDVGADDGVPLRGHHLAVGVLLLEGREHGLGIEFGRRQLVQHLLRHLAGGDQLVEAGRMAIAIEEAELAFVGVDVFEPELARVGVGGIGESGRASCRERG